MTWLDVDPAHPFGLATLPYGSFTTGGARRGSASPSASTCSTSGPPRPRCCPCTPGSSPAAPSTAARGRARGVGGRPVARSPPGSPATRTARCPLVPAADAQMLLPFTVADYVDFYASEHHARNIGAIFRPDVDDPLTPNWKHLPIGYHGRAGTVVVSGSPVPRPHGQRRTPDGEVVFGPSRRLDIEAEVGFVVGTGSPRGTPVGLDAVRPARVRRVPGQRLVRPRHPGLGVRAAGPVPRQVVRHLGLAVGRAARRAGARPRGPAAARPAAAALPRRHRRAAVGPRPRAGGAAERPRRRAAAVRLDVLDARADARPHDRQRGVAAHRRPVRLRHGQRSRAGPARVADRADGNGTEPLALPDGGTRGFLEDGDEVVITATAPGPDGARIGFGEVRGRITG